MPADLDLRCLYMLCLILIFRVARGAACVNFMVFTAIALSNLPMCGRLIRVLAVYAFLLSLV